MAGQANDPVVPDPTQPDSKEPAIEPKDDKGTPVNQDDNVRNLISDRDKNFEKARSAEERLTDAENEIEFIKAEKEKNSYVEGLVTKHGLTADEKAILDEAVSPAQADKLADQLVKHKEDATQKALEDLQKVGTDTPRLDADTINTRLKELKGTGNIEEMIELKKQL